MLTIKTNMATNVLSSTSFDGGDKVGEFIASTESRLSGTTFYKSVDVFVPSPTGASTSNTESVRAGKDGEKTITMMWVITKENRSSSMATAPKLTLSASGTTVVNDEYFNYYVYDNRVLDITAPLIFWFGITGTGYSLLTDLTVPSGTSRSVVNLIADIQSAILVIDPTSPVVVSEAENGGIQFSAPTLENVEMSVRAPTGASVDGRYFLFGDDDTGITENLVNSDSVFVGRPPSQVRPAGLLAEFKNENTQIDVRASVHMVGTI